MDEKEKETLFRMCNNDKKSCEKLILLPFKLIIISHKNHYLNQ